MSVDVLRLRELLHEAPKGEWSWDSKRDAIVSGERTVVMARPVGHENSEVLVDTEDLILLLAAVNALPLLLDVYEAARALIGCADWEPRSNAEHELHDAVSKAGGR